MDQSEINKLVTYIEENLRASPLSGLPFVDTRRHRTRLLSKQNHVVFGRRGAGKTSLARSIAEQGEHIEVYLNLEDYKDITFPNIVIHVLVSLLDKLLRNVEITFPRYKFWQLQARRVKTEIRDVQTELRHFLLEPDDDLREISTTEAQERAVEASPTLPGVSARGGASRSRTSELKREVRRSKIDYLRLNLTVYKSLLSAISALFGNRPMGTD